MWTLLLLIDKDIFFRAIDKKLAQSSFNILKLRSIGKLSNLKLRLIKTERKKPQDEIIISLAYIFQIQLLFNK